jgi:hypothetical protein
MGQFYKVWTIQGLVQPVAHHTLFGAQVEAPRELATLKFSQFSSAIISSDCPVSQRGNDQLCPTVDCTDCSNAVSKAEVRS